MSDEQGQAPATDDTTTTAAEDAQAQELLANAAQQQASDTGEGEGREPKTFDEDYVKRLREEAAQHRVKAKEFEDRLTETERRQQEQLDGIAKALGLKEADSPPDPEELTKQLTEAQKREQERESELLTLRLEREAEKAARKHSGDVDALLDSKTFARELAKLDPSDGGFTDALDELVKTTVEANPKYKASQAPAASSGDFSSGPGERKSRPSSLYDAVGRSLG